MTTSPRPVTELTDECPVCRARDLAADPDSPAVQACDHTAEEDHR